MKIIAKSVKGQEFLYSAKSAHKVSEASAKIICNSLNSARYDLKEHEVWFIHDVDKYDTAYEYAMFQSFTRRNGKILRVA